MFGKWMHHVEVKQLRRARAQHGPHLVKYGPERRTQRDCETLAAVASERLF